MVAFQRYDKKGKALTVVCNFSPVHRKGYRLGVPEGGRYEAVFCSDDAADGGAVLMVSSELPELLTNCDRILVMANGEINAEFAIADATEELLLKYMIG